MRNCKVRSRHTNASQLTRIAIGLLIFCLSEISAHEGQTPNDDHTVEAARLRQGERIHLDGRFDEPIWQRLVPATGFIQREPRIGEPSQNETEARFCYDEENLYVAVRCFDSDPDRVVKRLSRNERDMYSGDTFAIFMDPRHDHRTGVKFGSNPSGMREDSIRYNDYLRDNSWDGFWWVEARIDSLGWTLEYRIPFKNFRFQDRQNPVWGLNMQRNHARLDEQSFWRPLTRDDGSIIRMSKLGHLTGINDIKTGRRFEIIPYGLQGTTQSDGTDLNASTEAGLDVKYAITQNLTLDATLNPDFAQVEADIDEINLTRFPTRFPEQRPFFVEGNSVFLTPFELYFSRRIGSRGDVVGGGKVTGKAGPYSLGLISARTGDFTYLGLRDDDDTKEDATFNIARIKRDIYDKSNVGVLIGSKDASSGDSRVGGIDLSLRPGDITFVNAQVAGSWQDGPSEGNTGISLQFLRETDLFRLEVEYTRIAPDFEINRTGFLSKERFRGEEQTLATVSYRPRPTSGTSAVRQYDFTLWADAQRPLITQRYLDDQRARFPGTTFDSGFLDEKTGYGFGGWIDLSLDSGESTWLEFEMLRRYEVSGKVDTGWLQYALNTNSRRKVSAQLSGRVANFYNFDQRHVSREWATTLNLTYLPYPHWRFETRLQHSSAYAPDDTLEDRIWLGSLRTEYLFSTDTFLRLFFQARSDRTPTGTRNTFLISNVFGWEFRRGSRLFIAFNESRDDRSGSLRLDNQAIVFKIAHQIDL